MATVSQQDYYLKPGESITGYNSRIAALRGDTAEELASTQASSQKYAASNPNTAFATRLNYAPSPTNAAEINQNYASFLAPKTQPTFGDISNAVAGTAGTTAYIESEKQRALELEKMRQESNNGLFDRLLGNVESPAQARERAMKETGIDPKKYFAQQERGIKEIESLTNDYNKIVQAKDEQIAATQDKMGSMNFINNQTAQIERNAAPQLNRVSAQINAKAATLQALQGNFAEARSYVNQAVQDATADLKFRFDMLDTMYQQNEQNFENISSIYSDAYKSTMAVAQMEYERAYDEKMQIGELMLKYPTAGLSMDDTLDEAFQKASGFSLSEAGIDTNSPSYLRAIQVLNGQSKLSDFTVAEQAKIRDIIWTLPVLPEFSQIYQQDMRSGMNGEIQGTGAGMSVLPSALSSGWDEYRLQVAGPGAGRIESDLDLSALSFDEL